VPTLADQIEVLASKLVARRCFNVTEAAEYLGVKPRAVVRMLGAGTLPGRKVGNRWILHEQHLIEWLRGGFDAGLP